MSRVNKCVLVIASFVVFLFSMSVNAQTVTTTTVPVTTTTVPVTTTTVPTQTVVVQKPAMIVTEVPAPKIIVQPPAGSVYCFTVKAGWYQNVWVADHQVCKYANDPSGIVWVEGYWACSEYSQAESKCTKWDWKEAHWEKELIVY